MTEEKQPSWTLHDSQDGHTNINMLSNELLDSVATDRGQEEELLASKSNSSFGDDTSSLHEQDQKEDLKEQPLEDSEANPEELTSTAREKLDKMFDQHGRLILSQVNFGELFSKEKLAKQMQQIQENVPASQPLVQRNYSLRPDMKFGWKPKEMVIGAPIPLFYDFETFDIPVHIHAKKEFIVNFYGPRYQNSLDVHKQYANKDDSYTFKFPPNQNVIDAIIQGQKMKSRALKQKEQTMERFDGMNPILFQNGFDGARDEIFFPQDKSQTLVFDSDFESGNLDMAIQIQRDNQEFDLYMRVDPNTRGHHQWFYFSIENRNFTGKVKFNIVNFTKKSSLYTQGQEICYKSTREMENLTEKDEKNGWRKGGENITYGLSKLSKMGVVNWNDRAMARKRRSRKYYQLSFEFNFQHTQDKVFFAYSVPFTFSKQMDQIKELMNNHQETFPVKRDQFIRQSVLCHSLSGVEVPMLTITSRANCDNAEAIDPLEFVRSSPREPQIVRKSTTDTRNKSEFQSTTGGPNTAREKVEKEPKLRVPVQKNKKFVIISARVHPGETVASFMMEGFLKFITDPNNKEAAELRKRLVFKVIPMSNPDGVIIGNYRCSLSGNDLNRTFYNPHKKLHPTTCAIKDLIGGIVKQYKTKSSKHASVSNDPHPVAAFIDLHGHSRKKSIFMYGPHFPLHNEKYFGVRVIPKLLDDHLPQFRFFSSKFKLERSKMRTARIVLHREFGIMNCFTLEASMHGYISEYQAVIGPDGQTLKVIDSDKQDKANQSRTQAAISVKSGTQVGNSQYQNQPIQTIRYTEDLTIDKLQETGKGLGTCFYQYLELLDEDQDRIALQKEQKNKGKRRASKLNSEVATPTLRQISRDGSAPELDKAEKPASKPSFFKKRQDSQAGHQKVRKLLSDSIVGAFSSSKKRSDLSVDAPSRGRRASGLRVQANKRALSQHGGQQSTAESKDQAPANQARSIGGPGGQSTIGAPSEPKPADDNRQTLQGVYKQLQTMQSRLVDSSDEEDEDSEFEDGMNEILEDIEEEDFGLLEEGQKRSKGRRSSKLSRTGRNAMGSTSQSQKAGKGSNNPQTSIEVIEEEDDMELEEIQEVEGAIADVLDQFDKLYNQDIKQSKPVISKKTTSDLTTKSEAKSPGLKPFQAFTKTLEQKKFTNTFHSILHRGNHQAPSSKKGLKKSDLNLSVTVAAKSPTDVKSGQDKKRLGTAHGVKKVQSLKISQAAATADLAPAKPSQHPRRPSISAIKVDILVKKDTSRHEPRSQNQDLADLEPSGQDSEPTAENKQTETGELLVEDDEEENCLNSSLPPSNDYNPPALLKQPPGANALQNLLQQKQQGSRKIIKCSNTDYVPKSLQDNKAHSYKRPTSKSFTRVLSRKKDDATSPSTHVTSTEKKKVTSKLSKNAAKHIEEFSSSKNKGSKPRDVLSASNFSSNHLSSTAVPVRRSVLTNTKSKLNDPNYEIIIHSQQKKRDEALINIPGTSPKNQPTSILECLQELTNLKNRYETQQPDLLSSKCLTHKKTQREEALFSSAERKPLFGGIRKSRDPSVETDKENGFDSACQTKKKVVLDSTGKIKVDRDVFTGTSSSKLKKSMPHYNISSLLKKTATDYYGDYSSVGVTQQNLDLDHVFDSGAKPDFYSIKTNEKAHAPDMADATASKSQERRRVMLQSSSKKEIDSKTLNALRTEVLKSQVVKRGKDGVFQKRWKQLAMQPSYLDNQ